MTRRARARARKKIDGVARSRPRATLYPAAGQTVRADIEARERARLSHSCMIIE